MSEKKDFHANEEVHYPDESFRALHDLATRIMKVPKTEIEERERIWREWRKQRSENSTLE